jgi:hypothetical protein
MHNNVLMSTQPGNPPTQTNTNFGSVRRNVSLGKYVTYSTNLQLSDSNKDPVLSPRRVLYSNTEETTGKTKA